MHHFSIRNANFAVCMHTNKLKNLLGIISFFVLLSGIASCNAKQETETDVVFTASIVAVKSFYLEENDSVLDNLDSVIFSIDLDHGVIFNADSLPKGTNVSRLIPSITFAGTMSKAELEFQKDNTTDEVSNYFTNPKDSIDFTHPVKLNVTAQDGTTTFTYTIKVNVHQLDPDTIVWDKISISQLPSRQSMPVVQKTVNFNNTTYCLVEEKDGSITLSSSDDLNQADWIIKEISLGFTPNIESFNSNDDYLWILSDEGTLYYSEEGETWTPTDQTLMSVIGGYEDTILGIKATDDNFFFVQYSSQGTVVMEKELDPEFPISGYSQLGIIDTGWSLQPTAIMMGGVKSDNTLSSSVWGFDGSRWAEINMTALPALKNPMMARYTVFKKTLLPFEYREFDVWLLLGGMDENGDFNRVVYVTYDNGVNWVVASSGLQLPEEIPSLEDADLVLAKYPLSADLSDAWSSVSTRATRSSYTLEGTEITWDCPYLYIFGGYTIDGSLSTNIWRGVLNRLTFTPII